MSKTITELHYQRSKKAFLIELFLSQAPLYMAILIIHFIVSVVLQPLLSTIIYILLGVLFLGLTAIFITIISIFSKMRWKSKEYIITKDRIVVVDGIFGKRQRIYNTKGSTSMRVLQNPIQKFFKYGTISINFLGGDKVNFTNIHEPEQKIQEIEELIDKGEIHR